MLLMKILLVTLPLLLVNLSTTTTQADTYTKPEIQQAKSYKTVDDIKAYWLSEKLDGMRGYWDGKQLLTRQGNLIHSPKWFTQNWPTTAMDGELWGGRNKFQQTISCVRKTIIDESCWQKIHFMIFDLPKNTKIFTERIKVMQQITRQTNSTYLAMSKQFKIATIEQLETKLAAIVSKHGEGLMLHLGSAYYTAGRTSNILKLKKHQDAEARVIDHLMGKGKYQGLLGALQVKTVDGVIFKIGSGFTDHERANPPQIGSIITYKYNGKTQAGIPRFARYWRIRKPE